LFLGYNSKTAMNIGKNGYMSVFPIKIHITSERITIVTLKTKHIHHAKV
jgi:hypothetical protein